MRRKAGIVIGACAALVLAGTVGAAAWNRKDEGRPVGSWHEPPAATSTPVAAAEPVAPPAHAAPRRSAPKASTPAPGRTRPPESATPAAAAAGRQAVGELLPIDKLLGYGRRGDVLLSGRFLREAALQPHGDVARRLPDRLRPGRNRVVPLRRAEHRGRRPVGHVGERRHRGTGDAPGRRPTGRDVVAGQRGRARGPGGARLLPHRAGAGPGEAAGRAGPDRPRRVRVRHRSDPGRGLLQVGGPGGVHPVQGRSRGC